MTNPVITAHYLHRLLGMVVFMATLVRRGRLCFRPVQWWAATAWCQRTRNWSYKITVPQGFISAGSGLWVSPAVLLVRSSPCHSGNGSHALHRCVRLGLGNPTRLTLDTRTVVSISKIIAHKRSGDAGHSSMQ